MKVGEFRTDEKVARLAGENVKASSIEVRHADLVRFDGEFKVTCPVCETGLLLVRRGEKSFKLSRQDRCILCGQVVRYTDDSIAGEEFEDE